MPQIDKVGTKTGVGWHCSQTTPLSLKLLYNNIVLQAIGAMGVRKYTTTDILFLLADDALTTLYGKPRATDRPNPSAEVTQKPLSTSEKAQSVRLMRVNHCGEVCAQALYRGQSLTAELIETREQMRQAAEEELDHLAWCNKRLEELGDNPSILNPLWYAMSFSIGILTGFTGDKRSLGFVEETERQVVRHLDKHLDDVSDKDIKTQAVVKQMREDEDSHAHQAKEAGAYELPDEIKTFMSRIAKLMTSTSYYI